MFSKGKRLRAGHEAVTRPLIAVYDGRWGQGLTIRASYNEQYLPAAHGQVAISNAYGRFVASGEIVKCLLDALIRCCTWHRLLLCVRATLQGQTIPLPSDAGLHPAFRTDGLHVYHTVASQLNNIIAFFDQVPVRAEWLFSPLDRAHLPETEEVARQILSYSRILLSPVWRGRASLWIDTDDDNVLGVFPQDEGTERFIGEMIDRNLAKYANPRE